MPAGCRVCLCIVDLFLRATAYNAIAVPSVRRVDHTKTVELRIMKFSLYGSPIPLVFAG